MHYSKIAVIIVNWNAGDLLRQCLASLQGQTRRADRVLIVDNGSTDSSLDNLERDFSGLAGLKIIRLGENVGFARANNLGVSLSGEYGWIALLNPDAFPEPNWLENLIRAAERSPAFAAFGSQLIDENAPDRLDGIGDVYHTSGIYWRRGHGQPVASADHSPKEIFSPCAAAALYRADVFRELGGFDESFFCYGEDVDLGFRLRLLGHRCLYVPDALVRHVGSAVTGRRSDFSIYHGHRNLIWCWVKNMPSLLLWLYLPQHLLLNLISLIWFTMRGQGKIIFKAKWDALLGLSRIWRDRKRIQSTRRVNAWELRKSMSRGWLTPYLGRAGKAEQPRGY